MSRPTTVNVDHTQRQEFIFVNREAQIQHFETLVNRIPAQSSDLLCIWGVGGNGKSHLLKHLSQIVRDEKQSYNILSGTIDLNRDVQIDHTRTLLKIRNALSNNGAVNFSAFDLAFGLYWSHNYPDLPLPKLQEGTITIDKLSNVTGNLAGEVGPLLIESISAGALDGVPFVGTIISKLAKGSLKIVHERITVENCEILKKLFNDDILQIDEILALLPMILASDIKNHIEQNRDHRFVLFIDEYEKVLSNAGFFSGIEDSPFDQNVRDFINCTNGVLLVIASREKLPWGKYVPEWNNNNWLEKAHMRLDGLPAKYVQSLLEQSNVSDPNIQKMISQQSASPIDAPSEPKVFPFLLELMIGHYHEITKNGAKPKEEDFILTSVDFQKRKNEMVQRFLRNFDEPLPEMLRRLCVARFFNYDVLKRLNKKFSIGFSLSQFEELKEMSFVYEGQNKDAYVIHSTMRDCILESQIDEFVQETHKTLYEHYHHREKPSLPKDITEAHVSSFVEATHHLLNFNIDGFNSEFYYEYEAYLFSHLSPKLEPMLTSISSLYKDRLGEKNIQYLFAEGLHAQNLMQQRKLDEAYDVLKHIIDIQDAQSIENINDKLFYIKSIHDLAVILDALKKNQEAYPLFKKAYEARNRLILDQVQELEQVSLDELAKGPQPGSALTHTVGLYQANVRGLAMTADGLAVSLRKLGKSKEAIPFHLEALEVGHAIIPEEHPHFRFLSNNYALTLNDIGNYEEAEAIFRNNHAYNKENLHANDLLLGTSSNNLGISLSAQNKHDAALPFFQESLNLFNLHFPEGCSEIKDLLHSIATSKEALG